MSLALNTKHLSSFINEEEYKAIYPQVEAAHKTLEAKNGPGSDFLGWMYLPRDYDKCGVPHQKTGPPRWGQAQSFFVLCGRLSGCRGVPGVRSRRPGGCWSRGRGRPSSLRSGS